MPKSYNHKVFKALATNCEKALRNREKHSSLLLKYVLYTKKIFKIELRGQFYVQCKVVTYD